LLHLLPQEQRNILALAFGLKGIAAIRAVLNWAPVQAHATSHRVTAYYVTRSRTTAAFVTEWDQWREAGVSPGPDQLQGVLDMRRGLDCASAVPKTVTSQMAHRESKCTVNDSQSQAKDDCMAVMVRGRNTYAVLVLL
jgi:hypothetical protein